MEEREYELEPGALPQSAGLILASLFVLTLLAVVVALLLRFVVPGGMVWFTFVLLVLLALAPMLLAVLLAALIAARFAQRLYGFPRLGDGGRLLEYLLLGRPKLPPTFAVVRQGKVHYGDVMLERYGGPGGMFVTSDSAVILQKHGRLTRLLREPKLEKLEHFEKVWDVLELHPRRWVFEVNAITKDGIPITYAADVRFQIDMSGAPEEQEAAIWKAASCKWIRDPWRTEPDRLMTWPKRLIISATEGALRTILARYDLDQLLEEAPRAQIRQELTEALQGAVPEMGIRLLGVELGNIKLGDKIVQQWTAAWRAEKTREMHVRIAEGAAERAKALEQAKNEVRSNVFAKTVAKLQEAVGEGESGLPREEAEAEKKAEKKAEEQLSARLVLLSCIEVIKQIQFNPNVFLPDDIISVLDSVREQLGGKGKGKK